MKRRMMAVLLAGAMVFPQIGSTVYASEGDTFVMTADTEEAQEDAGAADEIADAALEETVIVEAAEAAEAVAEEADDFSEVSEEMAVVLNNEDFAGAEEDEDDEGETEHVERRTEYDYLTSDREMLPYDEERIPKTTGGRYYDDDYPDGDWFEAEVFDVKVSDKDVVTLEENENEWILRATEAGGTAVITIRLETHEGGETVQTYTYTVKPDERYEVTIDSESGSDRIQSGKTLKLQGNVAKWCFSSERGQYPGDMDGITCIWDWSVTDGNTDAVSIQQDGDDQSILTVTGEEVEGWQWAVITANVSDENGTLLGTGQFQVNVANDYPELDVRLGNLGLSLEESVTIEPVLYQYWTNDDGEQGKDLVENVRYRWNYDKDIVKITSASGEEVDPEAETGIESTSFTITRILPWNTGMTLFAQVLNENGDWEDCDERYGWLADLDTECWFADANGDRAYNGDVFTDGTLTFTLKTSEDLAGSEYKIDWQVGTYNESDDSITPVDGIYTTSDNTITFKGEEAYEALNGSGFNVRAVVKIGDLQVGQADAWVQPWDTENYYDWIEGTLVRLPYWGVTINKELYAYVRNTANPNGQEFTVTVTDVSVDNEDVLELTTEENSWNIMALNQLGTATVTMTYYTSMDETVQTHTFDIIVEADYYEVGIESSMGSDMMTPGDSATLTASAYHYAYDEDLGGHVEVPTTTMTYKWSIPEKYQDYFTGSGANTKTFTLKSTGKEGSGYVELTAYDIDANGKRVEVGSAQKWIGVSSEYTYLAPESITDTLVKDEAITVKPQYIRVTDEGEEALDNVRYRWEYDSSCLKITDSEGNVVGQYDDDEYIYTDASYGSTATFDITKSDCPEAGYFDIRLVAQVQDDEGNWRDEWERYYWFSGHNEGDWETVEEETTEEVLVERRFCLDCGEQVDYRRTVKEKTSDPVIWDDTGYDTGTKDGLTLDADGIWRLYNSNVFQKDFTGIVEYDGGKFFVTDGVLCSEANGLNLYEDKWYFLAQGQIQTQYSGFALYDDNWFMIKDGMLDETANGLYPYNGGTFLFSTGKLRTDVNGLWMDFDGTWYFLANGQVQTQHTGVAMYDGAFFYIVGGKLASGYNGEIEYDGATFQVVAGQLY